MVKYIFKEVKGIDYTEEVERIAWEHAMWNYGNDKPDIRFEMKVANLKTPFKTSPAAFSKGEGAKPSYKQEEEIQNGDSKVLSFGEDLGEVFKKGATGFKIFDEAETILAIAVPGCSDYSRKQTDELIEWVKRPQIGMGSLAFIKYNNDGTVKSSFEKFL